MMVQLFLVQYFHQFQLTLEMNVLFLRKHFELILFITNYFEICQFITD
jgi:hypothetical protein